MGEHGVIEEMEKEQKDRGGAGEREGCGEKGEGEEIAEEGKRT